MERSSSAITESREGVEDPFSMCVSPEHFAAHLEEILRRREPFDP